MKKKIVTCSLVVALLVIGVIGASLAYFTDTAKADNVFTTGNVKIKLNEQQRNDKGDALEPFEQNKVLNPIVGSAQGKKDQFGMPTAANYVDKMVTVTNTGKNDAYIRAYFAIPSALDDGYDSFNAGKNVLHFNFGNKVVNGVASSTEGVEWIWTKDGKWNYFETTIDNIKYNVYYADYATVVKAGDTTEQFVQGVYLDKSFDIKADGAYAFGEKLDLDEGWSWDNVKCPVFAVAVQAAGFDNASAAINDAFGANYNPWK
jgi:predicted ribosomally synthesized peptide with SipW-like signal peptide